MQTKLPHDRYIRYLVLTCEDKGDVVTKLRELHLPEASIKYMEDHDSFLEAVLPQSVIEQASLGRYTPSFKKHMQSIEIEEIFHGDDRYPQREQTKAADVAFVMGLHLDPILTLSMNALLIKGVPPDTVCQMLNAKFAAMLEQRHVDLYKRYFFNPAIMTRKAWNSFLGQLDPRRRSVYFTALSEDLDTLKTTLDLPASVSSSSVLQNLLTRSYQKAKLFLDVSTPDASKEARAWISTVMALTDKYEKYRSADAEDFANQLEMAFEFEDGAFATPDAETLKNLSEEISARSKQHSQSDSSEEAVSVPAEVTPSLFDTADEGQTDGQTDHQP